MMAGKQSREEAESAGKAAQQSDRDVFSSS
jgi:hypothetical protein